MKRKTTAKRKPAKKAVSRKRVAKRKSPAKKRTAKKESSRKIIVKRVAKKKTSSSRKPTVAGATMARRKLNGASRRIHAIR